MFKTLVICLPLAVVSELYWEGAPPWLLMAFLLGCWVYAPFKATVEA